MSGDASCLMHDLCRKVDSFEDLGLVIFPSKWKSHSTEENMNMYKKCKSD